MKILELTVYDNIHGVHTLHPLIARIIKTKHFQRLRNIKQMSITSHVYQSAIHTRFEHSIGTQSIAYKLMSHLAENQPELEITVQDILCVRIAALCHDIGHGPYSHLFQHFMGKLDKDFQHETISKLIFESIYDELKPHFNLYALYDRDKDFILELISPKLVEELASQFKNKCVDDFLNELDTEMKKRFARPKDKAFLFEVVSNSRNGLDVDKWDYLTRDSINLRPAIISSQFNFKLLLQSARVIKLDTESTDFADHLNQICYDKSQLRNIYSMFNLRFELVNLTVASEKCWAIKEMYMDLFMKMDKYFEFSKHLNGESKEKDQTILDFYFKLDDRILSFFNMPDLDERLRAAKVLKDRIDNCDFYIPIGSKCFEIAQTLSDEEYTTTKKKYSELRRSIQSKMTMKIIEKYPEEFLNCDEISVLMMSINYGMKFKNPVKHVIFYDSETNRIGGEELFASEIADLVDERPESFERVFIAGFVKKDLSKLDPTQLTSTITDLSEKFAESFENMDQ